MCVKLVYHLLSILHFAGCALQELERQENVMVICHQAVCRCLLAYFQDKSAGRWQSFVVGMVLTRELEIVPDNFNLELCESFLSVSYSSLPAIAFPLSYVFTCFP